MMIKNITPGVLFICDANNLRLLPGQEAEIERLTRQMKMCLRKGFLSWVEESKEEPWNLKTLPLEEAPVKEETNPELTIIESNPEPTDLEIYKKSKDALTLIAAESNPDLLQKWLVAESRSTIKKAIENKLTLVGTES